MKAQAIIEPDLVPLSFDVHAVVCVEDAPVLEVAFHQQLKDRSASLVNTRMEFFHFPERTAS